MTTTKPKSDSSSIPPATNAFSANLKIESTVAPRVR
jgi:hypothetical protein